MLLLPTLSSTIRMEHKIVQPLTSDELTRATGNTVTVQKVAAVIKLHRLALSICQSAEWGMGAMQSMCWLLQCRLPANSMQHKQLMDLCIYYFNYRTHTVGLNQIRTEYDPSVDSCMLNYKMLHYYKLCHNTVY